MKPTLPSTIITAPRWLFWARLAWLVFALFTFALNLWLMPYRLNQAVTFGWPEWSQAESLKALAELGISQGVLGSINIGFNLLTPLLYLSLGCIIFWKRSHDPSGLWWAAVFVTFWSPFNDLGNIYPAWKLFGDLNNTISTTLIFAALYTFPDGRFRPVWTRWATLGMAAIQSWRLFQPDIYAKIFPIFSVGFFLTIPMAQVYRYFRLSSANQRHQIKWVVFGLAVSTVPLATFLLVYVSTPALQQPTAAGMAAYLIGNYLWLAFAWTLPLSFFIAIFRSGLWDIDLVIRRTLVYALLTALLGSVYYGGVVVLQSILTADRGLLTGGGSLSRGQPSPVVIVISTLLIATLFNPLRKRIQDFIDRRFYRRKYDAEKALAEFAAAARNETDLQTLTGKLVTLVGETMQPERAGLWLKQDRQSQGVDVSKRAGLEHSPLASLEKQ